MNDLPYRIAKMFQDIVSGGRGAPGDPPPTTLSDMELPTSAKEDLLARSQTDLARIFYSHDGRIIHKWLHYLDIYDRYLSEYRGSAVRFLEIGVSWGGSLEMWRKYLGPSATIFGIDVNPDCANHFDPPNQVRIGSQADGDFLKSVVAEMGGVDIVLDDGSHAAHHQSASFATLFPLLSEGGLYMMEDLHTAYWPGDHRGGLKRKGTAIELVKETIDDMHRWYHRQRRPSHGAIGAVHAYDSMAIIEKKHLPPPRHIRVPLSRKHGEKDPDEV
jgi:cephalosporin hydroxylase